MTKPISFNELRIFLNEKYQQYNTSSFIKDDPIQVPKQFSKKEDIEISGFLTSIIAWGLRKTIIHNAKKMMNFMENSPYEFVIHHTETDLKKLPEFKHRTFQHIDFLEFIKCLKNIYTKHGGIESAFLKSIKNDNLQMGISGFKTLFFENSTIYRSQKHLPDPLKGSAAKRINMFLRWMVRDDAQNIDFGIWKSIKPSQLSCPLDVHSANVARKLGLINRKQNDSKALAQLDYHLRLFDKNDPAKYDFALFGLGIFEKF